MEHILNIVPRKYKKELEILLKNKQIEELRFRTGEALHYVTTEGETPLQKTTNTSEDLDYILTRACDYSLHSVQEQIAQGYLTMIGGHRLGICGTVVTEHGRIKTIRRLSSLSLRIAKEWKGIATALIPKLQVQGNFVNTLIISPPGQGKTTLLRDYIRILSSGEGVSPLRIGLVDERSEIAALQQGTPQFQVGNRTDILEACPKSQGLLFLLRSMNPQVLVVDEITAEEDIKALIHVTGCGVKLLATAHASNKNDLNKRPLYQHLLQEKIFEKLITIIQTPKGRQYQVEDCL